MAYYQDPDNEQDAPSTAQGMNGAPTPAPEQAAPPASPSGALTGSSAAAPSQPNQPKKAASSGSQPGFSDYLKANQGKAQQQLGQTVQNRVTGAANTAKNNISGAQNAFSKQLESGTLANRENAQADASKAISQARNIYAGGDVQQGIAQQNQVISGAQNDIAATNAAKAAETQRIASERARLDAEKKAYYDQENAARTSQVQKLQKQYNEGITSNSGDMSGVMQQLHAAQANLKNLQKDTSSKYDPQYKNLTQAEQLNAAQDTRLSGLQGQLEKAQGQLQYLQDPNTVSQVDPETAQRFADIINARYSGPQSLRQAGVYDPALKNVNTAQDMLNQVKTAGGRADLLTGMYGQNGQSYNRGLSGLDAALFNTNPEAVKNILAQGQQIGSLKGQLDNAQVGSELAARNRSNEIQGINQAARDQFNTGLGAQRTGTESAIDQRQADAKAFIDQLKSAFPANNLSTQTLSPAEATVLGLKDNERLFGLGGDALVQQRALNRDQLVSKDEQARLAALSGLAGLDQSQLLSKENAYSDASKAGTQTATDALDRDAVRQAVANAEGAFRQNAAGTTISGTGKGKGSSGGLLGKKTSTATKTLRANEKKALSDMGAYNFNSDIDKQTVGGSDLLKNLTNALTYANPQGNGNAPLGDASSSAKEYGEPTQPGLNAGDVAGLPFGGGLTPDFYQSLGQELPMISPATGLASNALSKVGGISAADTLIPVTGPLAPLTSQALGGLNLGNIASSISGGLSGSGSSAKAKAQKNALNAAKKNLQANFANTVNKQGLNNITDVNAQDVASNQRAAALEALLRRIS